MKRYCILLLLLLPSLVHGQTQNGISFTEELSWSQIIKKAKDEQKMIFLDVYATWCGPCKQMDQEVYIKKIIGDFLNSSFISVKVQVDSTRTDLPNVKRWYKDASQIAKRYKVSAMPTYLFFSPSGELIHRDLGYKSVDEFYTLVKEAADTLLNFAGQSKHLAQGTLSQEDLIKFAVKLKNKGMDSLSLFAAKKYKAKYIDNVSIPLFMKSAKYNTLFLGEFSNLLSYRDSVVRYIYKNPSNSETELNLYTGYSKRFIQYVVIRDWVDKQIKPNGIPVNTEPHWEKIKADIAKLFDFKLANDIVLSEKIKWYTNKKDWSLVAKYQIEVIDSEGIDTTSVGRWNLNNLVYEAFFNHTNDIQVMKKGIEYMEYLISFDTADYSKIDTYANILYKSGNKNKALEQENKALLLAEKEKDEESIKLYRETIDKIKLDRPTWDKVQ